MLAAVVIFFVVLAILHEPVGDGSLQTFEISGFRIPIHKQRFDLRTQEMIRARCAELREPRSFDAVYKTQHLAIVLNGSDETAIDGNLSSDEGNDLGLKLLTCLFIEILILRSAKCCLALIVRFDVL